MIELITFIKCRIVILINALPVYQILFITYLVIPIIYITRYRYKNFQTKSMFLSFVLLVIWVIQIFIWKKCHDIYYGI